MMRLAELKDHPQNALLYGKDESIEDLIKSIRANGMLEPLLITKDGRIISGHRRYRAALALGLTEVPVRILRPMTRSRF